MLAVRRCERVWWRTVRREWRRALGVYPLRCVRRHRAARSEIARLRCGRPYRTERRRRAMETHFTRGRVCRRALIIQGHHLNHAVVNDRRRAARSGADDAIPSSAGKPEVAKP